MTKANNIKIQAIVLTGMMTAVLCVLSIIQIPMPTGVPITLQTFAVALCGYVLGAKKGAVAAALYLLMGLIGIPVYSGFAAGPGILFGMTGGFIFGFILMALICGLEAGNKVLKIVLGVSGLACCHLCGVIQFSIVTGTGVFKSFLLVSVPYLIKDLLSVAGAYLISIPVKKAMTNVTGM